MAKKLLFIDDAKSIARIAGRIAPQLGYDVGSRNGAAKMFDTSKEFRPDPDARFDYAQR